MRLVLWPYHGSSQRTAKHQAMEDDRRVRLEQLKSGNDEEMGKLRTNAAETLTNAEKAWETQRVELEQGLMEQVKHTERTKKYQLVRCTLDLKLLCAWQEPSIAEKCAGERKRNETMFLIRLGQGFSKGSQVFSPIEVKHVV